MNNTETKITMVEVTETETNDVHAFQRRLYNNTMRSRQYVGNKEMGVVDFETMYFDDYQRKDTMDWEKVYSLARNWDDNAMDPICVVPHPEDFCFAVVNGMHRIEALKILNVNLPDELKRTGCEAIILKGFSSDPVQRKIEEATYFAKQMDQVENLTVAQKHRANVTRGIRKNVILEECIKDRELFISKREWRNLPEEEKEAKKDWGVITGFCALLTAAALVNGKAITNSILDIIEKSGWKTNPRGYCANVIIPLRTILNIHENDPKVIEAIIDYFKEIDPSEFFADAYVRYPKRKEKERLDMVLEEEVAARLNIEPIYVGGDIRVSKNVKKLA